MKNLFTNLLIACLFVSPVVNAQYFVADLTRSKDTLIFSVKPVTTITSQFSDIEFYVRWKASSGNAIVFGTPIPNLAKFPALQMLSWNNDVPDDGYNNQHFGHLTGNTGSKTYTNGTSYEVFRTVISGGVPASIELVADNTNVDPYYFAVLGIPTDFTPYDPASPFYSATGSSGTFYYKTLDLTDTWTGNVSTDWHTAANWLAGVVPASTKSITIGTGKTFYPVISDTIALNDLVIETGASVTVSGRLKIAGSIKNQGNLDVSSGTVEMTGASLQTINAGDFSNNIIKNLVVSNDVSLTCSDTLTGTLTIADGKTFATNDHLVLHSNVNGTARLASLPVDGSGTANAFITGKVNIERYLPLRKAWRLLGVPIDTTGAPSINESWQEGLTTASANPNLYPGYGVEILGGTVANGFDQGLTSMSTIRTFNNAAGNFIPLPVQGTNTRITNYPGYFLYVRGDRSVDLMQGNAAAVTPTTLRIKGVLKTGDQVTGVNAAGCTLVSNPFPSAVDFQTFTRSNVKNSFYLWDPQLAGSNGLGGYVAFSWNNGAGSYDATASVSPLSQYIPSGEAFFVESADGINPGTLKIHESDKTENGNDAVFGRVSALNQGLRVNLFSENADSSASLLDGVLTTYDDQSANIVDNDDTKKLSGSSETIGIRRDGILLAIERRSLILKSDTTFLNLAHMKLRNYSLEITSKELDQTGIIAVLKDNYSSDINNTLLNTTGTTVVPFSTNSDPASYAPDRFSIVFDLPVVVPVIIKSVKAYQQQKEIAVEWSTDNEINIKQYEVERSADGQHFTKLNTRAAIAVNGGSASYKFVDPNPTQGNNYYRIHIIEQSGKSSYSAIVKVNMINATTDPSITVYPNPVIGNKISLEFNNIEKGNYVLQLYNVAGQLVAMKDIQYDGSNTECFEAGKNFAPGKYELKLTGAQVNINVSVIKK